MLSAAILPANVPNLVMAGTAETLYGVHLGYLPYLFLHAPVLGFVKGAILVACTVALFPDRLDGARPTLPPLPPLSGAERRLSVILAIMLGLWLTDGWHGIAPAWIGLAAAVICLLPGIGVVSAASFSEIPLRTCFYVAALFGLTAVVNETGLGAKIGHALLSVAPLEPGHRPRTSPPSSDCRSASCSSAPPTAHRPSTRRSPVSSRARAGSI